MTPKERSENIGMILEQIEDGDYSRRRSIESPSLDLIQVFKAGTTIIVQQYLEVYDDPKRER